MIRDIDPFGLRIHTALKELIRQSAKDNSRSMNSEMIARLEASFGAEIDLSTISTADLVRELINRNQPCRITIEVYPQMDTPKINE